MFEYIIGKLAPHRCLSCCKEGILLCIGCQGDIRTDAFVCYRCKVPSFPASVCNTCKRSSPFDAVFVVGEYNDLLEQLIRALKFGRMRAAHRPLAELMEAALPSLGVEPDAAVIVPIPTAASRVRIRGYDQVDLLARSLGRKLGVSIAHALHRRHNLRQLGASRSQRHTQAGAAFKVHRSGAVAGRTVILVDDVVTTGATMDAAARQLKDAGATRVIGLAAAYQQAG